MQFVHNSMCISKARMKKAYTAEERAAYWKKQAQGKSSYGTTYKPGTPSGGNKPYTYTKSKNYSKKPKASGKGKTWGSAIGGGLGTAAGAALGGPMAAAAGGSVGTFLGGKLGHLVDQITGFGDYKVVSNSVMTGGLSPASVVNSTNKGGVIVRHREYVGDILATTGFTTQTFTVNPGLLNSLQGCFPWLAQFANSYEQYRFRGCLFEFQSTSSDALLSSATSTALGTVSMATQYDVTQPVFTDKRTMLNHEFANSRKPSCSFIHPLECKLSQTPVKSFYTRAAAVPQGADPGRFDFCRFTIATEGMQAAGGVLGELWVTYEIELFKQQLETVAFTDHFRFTGMSNSAVLGTVIGSNISNGATIGGVINGAGTAYSFPALLGSGTYQVTYQCTGTAAALALDPPTLLNCVGVNLYANNTSYYRVNSGTTAFLVFTMIVRITAQGAAFTFGSASLPSGPTSADLFVTQIAATLV